MAAPIGSAAAVTMLGFCSLRKALTPANVPPVPTAQVKPSILPSVCCQISGAVLAAWPSRFAWLSHWFAYSTPCCSVASSSFAVRAAIWT
jgi:hypothetical protein